MQGKLKYKCRIMILHFFLCKGDYNMAQKPFLMDKGIRVGDWYFIQNTDGDLKLSSTAEVGVSQRPFRVDHGFKIGTVAWFTTGQDFKASEDDSELPQRPFLADAGIQVGDWVIAQNADYDVIISVGGSVLSGLYSSTAISSGAVGIYVGWTISGLDTANVDGTVATSFEPGVITFSSDGAYMFIQDDQTVYRAELSTAWDVTTVGAFTQVFVFGENGTNLSEGCHWWSYDGMYFFQIVKYTAGDTELVIHRHAVGTAYDMTTYGGSYDEELRISHASIQTLLDENSITGVTPQDFTRLNFSSGGTKIILMSQSGHIIEFSTLSAWSASRSGSISYGSLSGYVDYLDISFNVTGTKCWVTTRDGSGNVCIAEYYMATPWDWSSLTFNSEWNLGSFTGLPLGIWCYNGKLYFGGTDLNGTGVNFITSITLEGGTAYVLPADPTYAISLVDSNGNGVTSMNEGATYTLNVETTNVNDGTVLWVRSYKSVSGTDPVTQDFTIGGSIFSSDHFVTISNNSASISIATTADDTTESNVEQYKFVITSSSEFPITEILAQTAWLVLNDTSQTAAVPVATDYSWSISTSWDLAGGNSNFPNSSTIADPSITPQMYEGVNGTYTITTDAPDGTQVFVYVSNSWVGSYGYADDPYTQDWTNMPYGWKTVSGGQITGGFTAFQDNIAENGEIVQLNVKDAATWTIGQYTVLARGQWIHIADDYSGGAAPWSAPSAGESFTGGEGYWESGVTHGYWYTASGSSTGNPRVTIRIDNTWDYDLRRDIEYSLQQMQVGDTFLIATTSMTVTGNITSGPDTNSDYTLYSFDVNVAPNTSNAYLFFYEFTVTV